MLIYFLIYIPFVLCAFYDLQSENKHMKKTILSFWVIVFTLFRGLRWDTGTDWDQFLQVYNQSHWYNVFSYVRYVSDVGASHMDYGYMFLNALFHELGLGYTMFLLFTNFIIMWCYKDFCLKMTKYPILTMILLMNVGMPFPVRQSISFAILLWGYQFLNKKDIKKYLLVVFCAFTIHKGALIGFPLAILPYLDKLYKIKWTVWMAIYISTFFIAKVFNSYISNAVLALSAYSGELNSVSSTYAQWEDTTAGLEGGFNNSAFNGMSFTLIFFLLLYLREKMNYNCSVYIKNFNLFFLLYATAACFNNLISSSTSPIMAEIVGRVISSIDMYPVVFPLLFVCFANLSKNVAWKSCLACIFVLFMLYKFWNQIPGSFYSYLFIPYKSIL